ncbi:Rhodanese-like domain-containing protein [Leucosporidium creatinivorum]|uniref:Rhodanese-like domain-containing protein n=1 Tax=Leucosporidium creatinivorum TaxID=106004 RepID=A0A1Y2DZP4_9BASI|nr:Rhodanese-like domain-containing protein [Leucosporidium creatinivorum]
MSTAPALITPANLKQLLDDKDVKRHPKVLDASWFMPAEKRHGFAEFKEKRILGSAYWDVDIIATKAPEGELQLPHMLPSPERFADACSRLGIARDSHVVVYDTVGVFSSPRTAFTFKAFGHDQVSILDGGLSRWIAEGYPIDTTVPAPINPHSLEEPKQTSHGPIFSELLYSKRPRVESYFIADIEADMTEYPVPELDVQSVRSYEQVVGNSEKGAEGEIVVDARPAGRFHGTDPDPRGLRSGHIPSSLSLPFTSLLSPPSKTEPSYRTLLPPAELEKVLSEALGGKDEWEKVKKGEKGIAATCGSGMTAAVIWLAVQVAGREEAVGVYDESWTGYASRPESVVEQTK